MTRAERVRALLDEYARQRYQNEREQREREREAFARDPELEALRAQRSLAAQSLRAAMNEPDADKRRAIAGDMRQGRAPQRRNAPPPAGAGVARGLSGGALPLPRLPRYRLCGRCAGALLRLLRAPSGEGEQSGQGAQTFEAFNAAFVPEENGQRARLLEAKGFWRNLPTAIRRRVGATSCSRRGRAGQEFFAQLRL